jgi:hypothetical protein
VQTRNVYTIPLKKPVIEKILSQSGAGEPIVEDQKILNSYFIILRGSDFYTETTQVMVDRKPLPATSKPIISDTQISFQLANDLKLQAGLHTVAVVQPMMMGRDITPQHTGTSSEPATFILSPQIQDIDPKIVSIPANGSVNVKIRVNPELYPGQKIALSLNALTADANGNFPAYNFQTSLPTLIDDPNAVPVDNVSIPIKKVVTGKFAVRIQVDDIESPVDFPLGSNLVQLITVQ